MPPPYLIYLITGQFDAEAFFQNGLVGAACIERALEEHGLKIGDFANILDFGCGCGRVLRHWKKLARPKLFGVDYNPRLIDWCRRNLPFAEFAVDKPGSALPFTAETFSFIYSISVFTHLTAPDQRFWMDELTRILRPGGWLLFTVHGTTRLEKLTPEQRLQFAAGSSVIVGARYSGQNICATYHPLEYVQNVLCTDLRLVGFRPGGAKDANQDMVLMQKPA
jgi:SAM-dependent methyltransferase